LPAVYLGAFAMGIATLGLPPTSVVIFVSINTMLVGFSEELMFRGILLQGLLSRLSIWPAIWVTSALFGAVHVLNVFITGELLASMIQAVAAFMSGMMFMAIRIRSGSLWPAIVYHALWDFCLVLLSQSPQVTHLQEPALSGPAMLLPMLLVLPHFLYGLFLLRKVGSTEAGG
jgi:membrane protease YdiL (CAAX protease family)